MVPVLTAYILLLFFSNYLYSKMILGKQTGAPNSLKLHLQGDFPQTAVVTVAERRFIYLFISLGGLSSCRRDGAACLFVPSQQTCSLKSTVGHRGKQPQGREELPAADGRLLAPLLDNMWECLLCACEARLLLGLPTQPTGVSLISLHVELPSTRLGPVLHVNSPSFCLLVYLQSNTDGHATTMGRDGRGFSPPATTHCHGCFASAAPQLLCRGRRPRRGAYLPAVRRAQIVVCELPLSALLVKKSIPKSPRTRQIKTGGKERRLSTVPSNAS